MNAKKHYPTYKLASKKYRINNQAYRRNYIPDNFNFPCHSCGHDGSMFQTLRKTRMNRQQVEDGLVKNKTERNLHHNTLADNAVKVVKGKFRKRILHARKAIRTFTSYR